MGVELMERGLNFTDPWGNRVEIVPYDDVQFTKADHVLKGMGVEPITKTSEALDELADKGMAAPTNAEMSLTPRTRSWLLQASADRASLPVA